MRMRVHHCLHLSIGKSCALKATNGGGTFAIWREIVIIVMALFLNNPSICTLCKQILRNVAQIVGANQFNYFLSLHYDWKPEAIVTQTGQHLVFDLLLSNYWVKFRSLFLVALASKLQKMPSSKLIPGSQIRENVPESWRSSFSSFMLMGGLKCWWPFWWGNVASTYFGCCHTSDLPGSLTKVKRAHIASACSVPLCQHSVCVMPVWGRAAVSSQGLHDDEIHVVCPTRGRERGRCHSVPHKHLLWVSTTGHSGIHDSWLDGLSVWSSSSCASNV